MRPTLTRTIPRLLSLPIIPPTAVGCAPPPPAPASEAALYGRLLAAAARHRCHSVAGLLARLRQLPSCAVAVDEAAAADLDLRNPEELLSSLRLPRSRAFGIRS